MDYAIFFSFIVLLHLVSASDPSSMALLNLKSEIVDDYGSLGDWILPPEENPNRSETIIACSWSGVTCNKNRTAVTELDLSGRELAGEITGKYFDSLPYLLDLNISENDFSGKLSPKIFNLETLITLDISRNNFSGIFPAGISRLRRLIKLDALSNSFSGALPTEISKIVDLRFLSLAGSYFTGKIPPEYGLFRSLLFMQISGNSLSGSIPPELGKLKTLIHMEIGYNNYEGSIPWQLGNMSELRYLDISVANLSAQIPTHLCNLTKLESFFLFGNHFTGSIRWEFSKIKSLTSLDLSENHISGGIPEEFSELKNLRLLSIMSNDMNGTVPEGIAKLPNLETLFIWDNYFSGSLPKSLGLNSQLQSMDASTNNLVGEIPPSICAGGILIKLILFSNNFTGSLFPSLVNCSSLIRLRLEDNSFSGEISLNISLLKNITYIDLSRNRFTGGIPMDIYQCFNLQHLNISINPELGGIIPIQTWSLPLLKNFSASSCNISGNLPPFQVCTSNSIIELNMNTLSGTIPESVSKCRMLQKMDLSNNNFTGHIPLQLANLSKLESLNVSFNDISGSIPSQGVFRSMRSSAFIGNPNLCGSPLRACGKGKRSGKVLFGLVMCGGVLLFMVLSMLGIIHFRKRNKGQWKMVSFAGLPQFTANDVLRSFDSMKSKAILPTGITVSIKKIQWEGKKKKWKVISEVVNKLGNARHTNLMRLLGYCYNRNLAYILYDYLPNDNLEKIIGEKRDWASKYRIVVGVAKGLCYLHHHCYPAIPHGDLRSSNILFDENSEPRLADFGLKFVIESKRILNSATSETETGESHSATKDELYMDIYRFGEIVLEILTDGRLRNAGGSIHGEAMVDLLRDIYHENGVADPSSSLQEEIKMVLELALLCTRSRSSDRPSMEYVFKVLSGLKMMKK